MFAVADCQREEGLQVYREAAAIGLGAMHAFERSCYCESRPPRLMQRRIRGPPLRTTARSKHD